MAFTEFCCRSGGSNLNAGALTGSSTEPGTSAAFTYASGNWVAGTGVFTVASGNPASDGVAVGDFASVYADGSSVTGFVGRVTARDATTITVSLTAKAGTAPTDGTGNRTLKIGGAWLGPNGTSGFPLTFISAALTNAAGDLPKINLKNDATYAVTASVAPTTTQNGTTVQGYTTAYGDGGRFLLDGGTSGASYNLFAPAVNKYLVIDGEFCNNGATGAAHGVASSTGCTFFRCVAHNVRGIGFFGGVHVEGEAYACNQSNTSGFGGFYNVSHADRCKSHSNVTANSSGFANVAASHTSCISYGNGLHGFAVVNTAFIDQCDAYENGGSGVNIAGSATSVEISNSNFVKNGAYGINGTTVVPGGLLLNCGFGSGTAANASGATNGLGSIMEIGSVIYPADETPWADPENGNFSITLAEAIGAGRGSFTQTAPGHSGTVGYNDIGAAQSQGGGSVPSFGPLSTSGPSFRGLA